MTGQMRNEKLPALAEALSGMRFGPRHAHAAASLLRATGLLDAGLPELQERVTAHPAAIPASRGADCDGATGPGTGQAGGAAALPAAYAAANTDTFPRERFRRPPARPGRDGREKAGCAVAAPSWSSCGTRSTTPPPATATSDPTGTPGTATAAATPATPAASSRPSATTSSSPSGRTPPDSAASDNRTTHTQAPGSACRGTISPCPELWSREWG